MLMLHACLKQMPSCLHQIGGTCVPELNDHKTVSAPMLSKAHSQHSLGRRTRVALLVRAPISYSQYIFRCWGVVQVGVHRCFQSVATWVVCDLVSCVKKFFQAEVDAHHGSLCRCS